MICYYGIFPIFPSFRKFSRYPPLSTPKIKKKAEEGKGKMNTKRINYLIKMISPLGHKIMFFSLSFLFYLAQGQGLTSCVCVIL